MIQRLVRFALSVWPTVLVVALVTVIAGVISYVRLDIEAYPNPVPPLVEVIAQPTGWSAEEVERYVTVPLEIGLRGIPGLDHIRSQSLFGLSDVKCYFRWGTDYWAARQEVINRLQFVQLPGAVQAQISPWSAIGEVYAYFLVGPGYSLTDLKTAQDWILEREFKKVPGVIDVVGFGGLTKQYHVDIDPFRLLGQGVTLAQVRSAIANANVNVGGQRLVLGEQSYTIRGIGLINSLADIENVVVSERNGIPIRVRDIAMVRIGHAPRLGQVGHDDDPDVVHGTVLMRYGAETPRTLRGIRERIDEIRRLHLLPPGMDIVPFYDRSHLLAVTTHTVMENLLIGMGLVSIVLFVFLSNKRAAIITAVNIPLALLVAFIGMVVTGTPANLISLGAVDFGIVVDSTVIMMENIARHAARGHPKDDLRPRILAAAGEVGGPMASSTLIIGFAFLPLFTMTGVEGVIFSPMAHTYAFAIGGAVLFALTLTPVLASLLMRGEDRSELERENVIMRTLHRLYAPLFDAALRWPRLTLVAGAVPLLASVLLFPLLGREFMPKLEEGNFLIRATLPQSVSLQEASRHAQRMRSIVRRHPEVITVISRVGRPDDGTDPTGFYNVELIAPLLPFRDWRHGLTKLDLTRQLAGELGDEFPGFVFNFAQMISDNVEEALSGVKGENSVKVVGPDLVLNERKAEQIVGLMSNVRGVVDLGRVSSLNQPSIRIVTDRVRCARYGLNTGDVAAVVQAALGGQAVTQVYEGEKHFDLTVRWQEQSRSSVNAIAKIPVASPDGSEIPLGELAVITEEDSPSVIYREDGHRYAPVKFSVRGRDLASTIEEAERSVAQNVALPYDTHLEWAGEINQLKEAERRLMITVPLTLLLIVFLTYNAVRNWLDLVIVLLSIPVACTGGVLALLVTRINFSVAAAMGFISVFGIAIQDAILVVTYYQRQRDQGLDIDQAAREAANKRFRPVLMTTLVATLGLLPAALSNEIGSQTQKPLAVVVIGGSLMLAVLTRVLQPPLLVVAHRWRD